MTKLISVQPASAVISPMPTEVAAWMQSGISWGGKGVGEDVRKEYVDRNRGGMMEVQKGTGSAGELVRGNGEP